MNPDGDRFIYLMRAGVDHYKVGIANDVLARVKGVQTGNPMTIKLVAATYIPDALKIEKQIHHWLDQFKADGGREWFILAPEQALTVVTKMTELTISADLSRFIEFRNLIARQTALEEKMDAYINGRSTKDIEGAEKIVDTERTKELRAIDENEFFKQAMETVIIAGKASSSMLQRRMKVGYARAARLIDEIEEAGVVSAAIGARPREVLLTSPSDFKGRMPVSPG